MSYTTEFSQRELSRFHTLFRKVIEQALAAGWKGNLTKKGGLSMVPPEGFVGAVRPIYIPITSPHPEAAAKRMAHEIAKTITKIETSRVRVERQAEPEEDVTPAPVEELVDRPGSNPGAERRAGSTPAGGTEDVILTIAPFMSRLFTDDKGGHMYPSQAINERHWRSGKIDYACTWPGCGYTAPSYKQVGPHRRKHKTPTPQRKPVLVEPGLEPGPAKGPITRLAHELAEAFEAITPARRNPHSLAEFIVTQRRARAQAEVDENLEPEGPPTPETILARVRAVLMGQEIANQRALEEELNTLREQVERERDERERLEQDLEAFASLATDIRRRVTHGDESATTG